MKTEKEIYGKKGDELPVKHSDMTHDKYKTEPGIKYQCPMKCHGGELFDEQWICPYSKMQMIPVGGGYIFY